MNASNFNESNAVLGPPKGLTEDDVRSLYVCRTTFDNGDPVVISCWKPTFDEMEEINRTGRVWLMILGTTQLPVKLTGTSPFSK